MTVEIGRRLRSDGMVFLFAVLVSLSIAGEAQTVKPAGPSPNQVEVDAKAPPEAASEPATLSDYQAAAALAAVAVMDGDPAVREEAVRSLSGILEEADLPVIRVALLDVDARVRAAAVDTLSDMSGEGAVWALAFAMTDADVAVREAAAYALGKIGGATAIAVLQQALGDRQDSVREAAGDLLAEQEAGQRKRPRR